MDPGTRQELRLLALAMAIVSVYGVVVTAFAFDHGQVGLIFADTFSGVMAAIWGVTLGLVFASYLLDLVFRRRPARPLATLAREFREHVLRGDWLLARTSLFAGWFFLMLFFMPFKAMIGHVRGFPLDHRLAALDRLIFAGTDPWRLTHALFGSVPATWALHLAYNMWFGLMWVGIIYLTLRPEKVRLRSQYLIAFLLSWIIIGSFGAYLLASAGPCFYERAFGDPYFRPLMTALASTDASLRQAAPGLGLQALDLQNMLWNSFAARTELFGGGISAMPSMHVSVAVLMACGGWGIGRRLGWAMTAFAVTIWIGSVHLGWHYAVDGIVGAALTLGIWRMSGWLVDRFVLGETPAAALQPALAE
jgi:hypothetical protein